MAKEQCKWTQKEDEILKIAVGQGLYTIYPVHRTFTKTHIDVERVDWLSIAQSARSQ